MMSPAQLDCVLSHVHRLSQSVDTTHRTDRELLAFCGTDRQNEAFATLMKRHGSMVWGVCRRILGNDPSAEDAFQAAFLALLQKAPTQEWQESIGGWLHCVACRIAKRARAQQRAQERGEPLREGVLSTTDPDDLTWRELCQVLDQVVQGLPDHYRDPIILCYFEGRTNTEAADELRWSRGTLSGRLARAREILRRRLEARGLAPSCAAFIPLTLGTVATANPPGEVLHRALQLFGGERSVISSTVRALAHPVPWIPPWRRPL